MHTSCQSENLMGTAHLIELRIDGRIILKWILINSEDVNRIQLTQDRGSDGFL
jgi:hypothetical protein